MDALRPVLMAGLLAASPALCAADDAAFQMPADLARSLAALKASHAACPAPVPGGRDAAGGEYCAAGELEAPDFRAVSYEAAPAKAPLNAGFKALGPEGTTGSVDGPGGRGNGSYTVLRSAAGEVALKLSTGYISAEFRLKRDEFGNDTLEVKGKKWNKEKGAWGPYQESVMEASFSYDASEDSGRIRYKEKGKWKQESYWDGRDGSEMTIEFGGGWDHAFSRD